MPEANILGYFRSYC